MKAVAIVGIMLACGLGWAATTKEIRVSFDEARLTSEQKGAETLFRYRDMRCRFVELGPGAPVLPCVEVCVLMPNGATYRNCKAQMETQPLSGTYSFFTRGTADSSTARRYPRRLVEFAGVKRVAGYTIFSFRTYPVSCQPADGSAARTVRLAFAIEYDLPAGGGTYGAALAKDMTMIKRLVINPDDADELVTRPAAAQAEQPASGASDMGEEFAASRVAMLQQPVADDANEERSGFNPVVNPQVYVNDNDKLTLSVLQF